MDINLRGWAAGLQIAATMTVVSFAIIGVVFTFLFVAHGVW